MEILRGLRKHFPKAYFIRWGDRTCFYLDKELGLEYSFPESVLLEWYPYDIVNMIWQDIYEDFSKRCRV